MALTERVVFKTSPEELALYRRDAKASRMKLSEWIRNALEMAEGLTMKVVQQPRRKKR